MAVSVRIGVSGKKSAVSVAWPFRFIGTAARRVSHISRRAFQLLGFFGSLALPRAKEMEDQGAFLPRFSGRLHSRSMHRSAGKVRNPCALAPSLPSRASVKSFLLWKILGTPCDRLLGFL